MSIDLSRVGVSGPLSVRFRPDLALSHRFAVPARLDYADVIAPVTATKARSPTLVGIIWKSA
jgi:hypothetical protein